MRKPKRLTEAELAPYIWELPEQYRGRWGTQGYLQRLREDGEAAVAVPPIEPIQWQTLFQNDHPVELEVGFGKGLFLVNAGSTQPKKNFFGIEIIRKYQMYAAGRIARRELKNVITCCGDAKLVMRDFIPKASLAAVHVYFPDPWWKTRHRKRLLFTPEFRSLVLRVLIPGGHLHFVTDVQDYFQMVTGMLAEEPALAPVSAPDASAPQHDMDYLTNFERKFRKEGRPIYRSCYQKL